MPYAYNRARIHSPAVPLGSLLSCATSLGDIAPDWYSAYTSSNPGDTDMYVEMPFNEWWRSQDSNDHYQLIPVDAQARAQHNNVTKYGASQSYQYTDGMFMFGDDLALDGKKSSPALLRVTRL